ncbi:MAG TPA: hypothetical protein VFA97_07465 [Gaiellaceae bacterium]|nr:hypothetical protein [Gaiellaceae bacterium]
MKAGRWGIGALLALVVAGTATAAVAAPPAGTPDPKAVVLTAADFANGQAKDLSTKTIAGSGTLLAGYANVIGFLHPYGQSRYLALESEAFVETDAASATHDYGVLLHEYETASVRKQLLKDFTSGIKDPKVVPVAAHALGVQQSAELGFVVTDPKKKATSRNFSISVIRVDRILVLHVAAGVGRHIYKADARTFATKVVAHAATVLVPISVGVPSVSGTAQEGQTLTATSGTWGGTPTSYAYQWQNCDPTGTTCNPIANATASTYIVQPTDANLTIRVQVTATNAFGSTVETSAVTAAVAAPPPPPTTTTGP